MAKKATKQSSRGRKQDRARVAGGQEYEVQARKTGRSKPAVKKAVKKVGNSRKHGRLGGKMNPDGEAELKRLAEADAHIADAQSAVTQQMAQVEAVRAAGHDPTSAERDLTAFQETLAVLQDHRAAIVEAIEQLDSQRA